MRLCDVRLSPGGGHETAGIYKDTTQLIRASCCLLRVLLRRCCDKPAAKTVRQDGRGHAPRGRRETAPRCPPQGRESPRAPPRRIADRRMTADARSCEFRPRCELCRTGIEGAGFSLGSSLEYGFRLCGYDCSRLRHKPTICSYPQEHIIHRLAREARNSLFLWTHWPGL